MKKNFLFLFLLSLPWLALAQTGTVTGRVIDNETLEGLPNANVFIDQTTFGVAADIDGRFVFKNIPTGSAVLVFSFVGYKPYQRTVSIEEGKTVDFVVRLIPEKEELQEVEIKAEKDKKWEADLRKFQRHFLGDDRIGAKCSISNPWVLEFSEDKETKDFLASASEPLQITNQALGYKVTFHLKEFRHSNYAYRIAGNSQFTEFPSEDPKEVLQQMNYRMESYLLSQRHFFKSILDQKLKENGYQLYIEKAQFGSGRSQVFSVEVGKSVAPWSPGATEFVSKGVYRIRLPDKLEIHHTNMSTDRRIYRDVTYAISWMEVRGGFVLVNDRGVPLNPGVVITSGEMNLGKVGHMLPLNFTPGEIARAAEAVKLVRYERLREKAYLATDRSYYYPGETIRLKAYMNYGVPALRDTLSTILHVDLINQEKKTLFSEKLQIDSGFAFGGIKIPDSLRKQVLYLRAWTNWMRNYGTSSFFVKPVYLLNTQEVPAGNRDSGGVTPGLTVSLDKQNGHALQVSLKDSVRGTIPAHLSISVSKILRGTPSPDTRNILDHFPIGQKESSPHSTFSFPIEYAQQYAGQILNPLKKPMEGSITLILGNMEDVRMINTKPDGLFVADSLTFFDSVTVATQVKNKRGKVEGNVVWKMEDQPFADFSSQKFLLNTLPSEQVIFSPDKDSRLLREVTVTEKRPAKTPEKMPYGEPDHVITSEQLISTQTGMNLLNSLVGKVPGMQVLTSFDANGAKRKIVMRGGTTTIRGSLEPLVYINGVPAASTDGTAASIIEQINPLDVERIEIITRTNAMMGALGANGLIAIFTKIGITKSGGLGGGFTTYKWKGLQIGFEKTFANGASAATVYWNPQVILQADSYGLTIPLNGLAPGYYQVLVEGVNIYNEPVRRFQTIEIE